MLPVFLQLNETKSLMHSVLEPNSAPLRGAQEPTPAFHWPDSCTEKGEEGSVAHSPHPCLVFSSDFWQSQGGLRLFYLGSLFEASPNRFQILEKPS